MNIGNPTKMLGLSLGLSIMTCSTALADFEFSKYEASTLDFSAFGEDGGVISVNYQLAEGNTDVGLGSEFSLDFTLTAWSDSNMTFSGADTDTYVGGTFHIDYEETAGPHFPVGTATSVMTIEGVPLTGLNQGWQYNSDALGLASSTSTSTPGQIKFSWDVPFGTHGTTRTLTYEGSDLDGDGSTNFSSKIDRNLNFLTTAKSVTYIRSVPEPSSVLLTSLSVFCLALRRRR